MKKFLIAVIISIFLGENATASEILNTKETAIATVSSYAARGDMNGLKQALNKGLDDSVNR